MNKPFTLKTRKPNWNFDQLNQVDHTASYNLNNLNTKSYISLNNSLSRTQKISELPQQQLQMRIQKKNQLIAFYKSELQRRQIRNRQNLQERRKQKENHINRLKQLIFQQKVRNLKLSSAQHQMKISMSYSSIVQNSQICQQEILHDLQ